MPVPRIEYVILVDTDFPATSDAKLILVDLNDVTNQDFQLTLDETTIDVGETIIIKGFNVSFKPASNNLTLTCSSGFLNHSTTPTTTLDFPNIEGGTVKLIWNGITYIVV